MEAWLEWARGPAFYFSLAFMVLGLLRHAAITLWEMARVLRRAGDRALPVSQLRRATLKWLVPLDKIRQEFVFSVTSILFHIAILIVPIFLGGHFVLWARRQGVPWPALPNHLADLLTILAIIMAVALVLQRILVRASRDLSGFQDYALPLIIAVPFVTGFMVMHPANNPFSFQATLFVHVMSANLVLILLPITKLSHAVLMPGFQTISELGWHWPSDSGSRVGIALGKEEEPV